MDSKNQILKGRKNIDNKYQKAKIKNLEQKLDSQKYNIKSTKENHENFKNIWSLFFFNRVFFRKVIVGIKMKVKVVIKN